MKFRPRFSVRTLAIFVTLVCVYFGAWEATMHYGVRDVVTQRTLGAGSAAELHRKYLASVAKVNVPFIVVLDPNGAPQVEPYFWFFGYIARLDGKAV